MNVGWVQELQQLFLAKVWIIAEISVLEAYPRYPVDTDWEWNSYSHSITASVISFSHPNAYLACCILRLCHKILQGWNNSLQPLSI